MNIIEYIKEYVEDRGSVCRSREEYDAMTSGIKAYLKENGIDEAEEREYFQRFVSSHFKKIEDRDLKDYLINYSSISKMNDILIRARTGEDVSLMDRAELNLLLETVKESPIGEKYIPVDEIRHILAV